jgi:hypothetical protein
LHSRIPCWALRSMRPEHRVSNPYAIAGASRSMLRSAGGARLRITSQVRPELQLRQSPRRRPVVRFEGTCDWELNWRARHEYDLLPPEAAIDPGEDAVIIQATYAIRASGRETRLASTPALPRRRTTRAPHHCKPLFFGCGGPQTSPSAMVPNRLKTRMDAIHCPRRSFAHAGSRA